jgi:hypothetical protein
MSVYESCNTDSLQSKKSRIRNEQQELSQIYTNNHSHPLNQVNDGDDSLIIVRFGFAESG